MDMSFQSGKQSQQSQPHHRNYHIRYPQHGYQYDKLDHGSNGAGAEARSAGGTLQHQFQQHQQHLHSQQRRYAVPPGRGYGPPPSGPEAQPSTMSGYHPAMVHPSQHYRPIAPDIAKTAISVDRSGIPGAPSMYQHQQPVAQHQLTAAAPRPPANGVAYAMRRPDGAVMVPRLPAPGTAPAGLPYPGMSLPPPAAPPPSHAQPLPHHPHQPAAGFGAGVSAGVPVSYAPAAAAPPSNPQQANMVYYMPTVSHGAPAPPVPVRQPYMTPNVYQTHPGYSVQQSHQQGIYGGPVSAVWRPGAQMALPAAAGGPQPPPQQLHLTRLQLPPQHSSVAGGLVATGAPTALPPGGGLGPAASAPAQQHARSKRVPIIDPRTGREVSFTASPPPTPEGPGPGEPAWRPPAPERAEAGWQGAAAAAAAAGAASIPGRRHRPHNSASTSELGDAERPAAHGVQRQRSSASTSELEPAAAAAFPRPEALKCAAGIPGSHHVLPLANHGGAVPPFAPPAQLPVATVLPQSAPPPPLLVAGGAAVTARPPVLAPPGLSAAGGAAAVPPGVVLVAPGAPGVPQGLPHAGLPGPPPPQSVATGAAHTQTVRTPVGEFELVASPAQQHEQVSGDGEPVVAEVPQLRCVDVSAAASRDVSTVVDTVESGTARVTPVVANSECAETPSHSEAGDAQSVLGKSEPVSVINTATSPPVTQTVEDSAAVDLSSIASSAPGTVVSTKPVAVVEPLLPAAELAEPGSPPVDSWKHAETSQVKATHVVPNVSIVDGAVSAPVIPSDAPVLGIDDTAGVLVRDSVTEEKVVTATSEKPTPTEVEGESHIQVVEEDWTATASRAAVAADPVACDASAAPRDDRPSTSESITAKQDGLPAGAAPPDTAQQESNSHASKREASDAVDEHSSAVTAISSAADGEPDTRNGDQPVACTPSADTSSGATAENGQPGPEKQIQGVIEKGGDDANKPEDCKSDEQVVETPVTTNPFMEQFKVVGSMSHGKTQYCRADLLRLQHAPLSQRRPAALPDLPSVVRRSGATDARQMGAGGANLKPRANVGPLEFASGFKPVVMGPPGGKYRGRGPAPPAAGMGRLPQANMGPMPPRRIEISLNRDVKLRTSENAWKANVAGATEELDSTQKVIRALKGILNKLTPSNLERQIERLRQLELNTAALLADMIDVLFEKALVEPTYAAQYAAVCKAMARTEVVLSETEGKKMTVTFRKLLIQQCQHEFEKDKSSELNREQRLKEISQLKDEQARKLQMHQLSEEERKMRYRSNGNIRFIGELYKLEILNNRIMHQCITKLMRDKHEDSYECLCKLMTTIGEKLEESEKQQESQYDLNNLFIDLKRICKNKVYSSRIRFMILDLIEMRDNNWVNTRTVGKAKPQKIDEVHKEAAQQLSQQQATLAADRDRRNGDRRGGRPPPPRTFDSWNSAAGRPHFDANRMMMALSGGGGGGGGGAAPSASGPPVKLGPGGVGAWSQGSKGGGRPSPSASPGPPALGNRFAVLRGGPSSRGSSADRTMRSQSGSRASSADRGRSADRDRSSSRSGASTPAPAAVTPGARLTGPAHASADDMRKQARTIVSEFLEVGNVEAAMEDCESHLHETTVGTFVAQCLDAFVDARRPAERQAVGRLHVLLLERLLLTPAVYAAALQTMLDAAPDLATDVPAVWQNIAQMITPVLLAGKMALRTVARAAGECVAAGSGRQLLLALLQELKRQAQLQQLQQQLPALVGAHTDWWRLLGDADRWQDVLTEAGVWELCAGRTELPAERAPEEAAVRALLAALRSDASLADWLQSSAGAETRRQPAFTAHLTAAVGFFSIVLEGGALRALPERLDRQQAVLRAQLASEPRQLEAAAGLLKITRFLHAPAAVFEALAGRLVQLQLLSTATLLQLQRQNGGPQSTPELQPLLEDSRNYANSRNA